MYHTFSILIIAFIMQQFMGAFSNFLYNVIQSIL